MSKFLMEGFGLPTVSSWPVIVAFLAPHERYKVSLQIGNQNFRIKVETIEQFISKK